VVVASKQLTQHTCSTISSATSWMSWKVQWIRSILVKSNRLSKWVWRD